MFSSFAITICPKDGISDLTISKIVIWLKKQPYSVAVIEKDDEARHLHAQIWLDQPRAKGDGSKQLQRICEAKIEDFDIAQKKVMRGGIKIAYSDWYEDYLLDNDEKVDPARILIDSPPEQSLKFYPTEEEQEATQALANAVSPQMLRLEQGYFNFRSSPHRYGEEEVTLRRVGAYLAWSMFDARTEKVLLQKRDRVNLCKTLFLYINKSMDTEEFLAEDKESRRVKALLEQHSAFNSQ